MPAYKPAYYLALELFFFYPHAPFITAFVPTYKPATIIYALKPAAYVYA